MDPIPASDFDSPWKEALARYLPQAFALFFPQAHAEIDWARGYTLLDKELQQVVRDADLGRRLADALVQVWRRDGTDVWVLIHIEVQGQPEPGFSRRMFVYYYRIYDRHERPIMSVAVLADEQESWRPDRFTQSIWGCTETLEYPVVKLLDWRARREELEASDNPFAVVVRAHLAAQETREAAEARGRAKVALIRGLYRRGFDRTDVLELFRLIDWLLALPEEADREVWRTIEALEEEKKMQYLTSVERIGRADGRLEGTRDLIRRMAERRFGPLPKPIEQRVADADQAALENFADRLITATTIEDLLAEG